MAQAGAASGCAVACGEGSKIAVTNKRAQRGFIKGTVSHRVRSVGSFACYFHVEENDMKVPRELLRIENTNWLFEKTRRQLSQRFALGVGQSLGESELDLLCFFHQPIERRFSLRR